MLIIKYRSTLAFTESIFDSATSQVASGFVVKQKYFPLKSLFHKE